MIRTGYFEVDLASPLLFALAIGIFFGLGQWAALRHLLGRTSVHARDARQLWVPVTAIGIATMILPLLWLDAVEPAWLHVAGLPAMVPGIIALAMMQSALIRKLMPRRAWIWRTAAGAVAGAALGLPISEFLSEIRFIPNWIYFAGTVGLVIGRFQAGCIDRITSAPDGDIGDIGSLPTETQ
jgi:hypothetical protein